MHTYEAIYETGVIKLLNGVQLPDHTKVYVSVPEANEEKVVHFRSPHHSNREQAGSFVLKTTKLDPEEEARRDSSSDTPNLASL